MPSLKPPPPLANTGRHQVHAAPFLKPPCLPGSQVPTHPEGLPQHVAPVIAYARNIQAVAKQACVQALQGGEGGAATPRQSQSPSKQVYTPRWGGGEVACRGEGETCRAGACSQAHPGM